MLDEQIRMHIFEDNREQLKDGLVRSLTDYKMRYNMDNIVLGMSGGIDSALTASLFKEAGWNVTGVTLPIHQNETETDRGVEACEALDIDHVQIDLSDTYDFYLKQNKSDTELSGKKESKAIKVRRGNVRARLRMLTLYNLANKLNGIVGSTDNFSELSAGFWTLHGDVGDVAPIQSLSKSWEVPALAEIMNVPASIISATPTDGLGVDAGDEAQFGFSYLQFDLVLYGLLSELETEIRPTADDLAIVENVKTRIRSTGYKRLNPVNLNHPVRGNELYSALSNLDDKLLKGE
jgi:nicotinamide-nucleotide amidase